MRKSWPLVPQVRRAAKAGECVAELMFLQEGAGRPLHKAVRVKLKLHRQWKVRDVKESCRHGMELAPERGCVSFQPQSWR